MRLHTQFAGSLTSVHEIGSGSINNNNRINDPRPTLHSNETNRNMGLWQSHLSKEAVRDAPTPEERLGTNDRGGTSTSTWPIGQQPRSSAKSAPRKDEVIL